MENQDLGDLSFVQHKCCRTRRCFNEKTTLFFSSQILEALEYIHDKGAAYRDLKPENVMMDYSSYVINSFNCLCVYCNRFAYFQVKLGDFGFCKYFPKAYLTQNLCVVYYFILNRAALFSYSVPFIKHHKLWVTR